MNSMLSLMSSDRGRETNGQINTHLRHSPRRALIIQGKVCGRVQLWLMDGASERFLPQCV
ncbi:hypothetical protein SKAU_G00182220 [Synaphobranchus kaupii]|uniref:Uncharacterized protein n=1 Tax=Synaphobranchus kaupii TaxID=118154 RepID=A0A9Q1FBS3_SYNKA|nr:hypothetical protein SKAU_G00182220 [Synaphobranchus kaupii]